MIAEIRLPSLGQTSDEMSIVEWYKSEGDTVEIAEPLLCVETDKSQVDVESAEEGILLKIVAFSGEVLSTGALLAYVGDRTDEVPGGENPTLLTAPVPGEPALQKGGLPQGRSVSTSGRVRASPVVRKLATDLGVDLGGVSSSAVDGMVSREDVQKAYDESVIRSSGTLHYQLQDILASRRAIARRLTRSAQTIPQFSLSAHLDARSAESVLVRHATESPTRLTYTHLMLRNVARALRKHPAMRRVWDEDGPRYRTFDTAHVGLAVAGDDTLYVPTILAPDSGTLEELIESVSSATIRGRDGKLSHGDQTPSAITVSNLGMFGVEYFTALVDPDQSSILAVASVQDGVVSLGGVVTVIPQLAVTLTCDHRSIDGAQAAQFMRTLKGFFESDPEGIA